MGMMMFQLPPHMPQDAVAELERTSIAGGQDCMPYPTQIHLDGQQLIVQRNVCESGNLVTPWQIDNLGRFMVTSATLIERPTPYFLTLELARGKINQLRGQTADWRMGGLQMPEQLAANIQQATRTFGKAAASYPNPDAFAHAGQALALGYQAAHFLVHTYINQVFHVRHSRQPKFDTTLACRLPHSAPPDFLAPFLTKAFNAIAIPFAWQQVEPSETEFVWSQADALVDWAKQKNLQIVGGPLLDYTGRGIPDWIWGKQPDILAFAGFACDFVEMAVRRYSQVIRTWHVTSASNWTGVVAHNDEELLWLTHRLIETVRKVDPNLEVVVGVTQPWGDYMAQQARGQSPFVFADSLLRTGIKLAALDLEMVMSVSPRGSYCRDLLDASRVLDLYALLGLPLQVTLGYPSSAGPDAHADPDLKVAGGFWRRGFVPEVQADWVHSFASLALCKPFVRAVHWVHFSDVDPHLYPHCGLVDVNGSLKPSLEILAKLRAQHLH
jgi:hypothetical protein